MKESFDLAFFASFEYQNPVEHGSGNTTAF